MKYKFIKIDEDTTKLQYKDKEFEIKRDVELQSKVQGVVRKARILMTMELAKMGMTTKDLIVEKKEGSKTYYDNSNLEEIEKQYETSATQELYDELTKKYCGMNFVELMMDIGIDLDSNDEGERFGIDLTSAFMGKDINSPS